MSSLLLPFRSSALEPLADFRAACKRSISFERQKSESVSKSVPSFRHQSSVSSRGTPAYLHQSSVTSRGTPAYLHQSSVTSRGMSSHLHQPPAEPDQSLFDGGIFSQFNLEDIPGAAHPSPFPSRRDLSRLDAHDDDVFEAEEDRVCVVFMLVTWLYPMYYKWERGGGGVQI